MAVSEETPIASSVANGATTVFPHSFTVLDAGDFVATGTLNGVTTPYVEGVDFTLSGVGTSSGSMTFAVAPANGTFIVRWRDTQISRSTDYQNNGDLLAETVNADFNRLYYLFQEVFNGGKGVPTSLRVPNGETINALPAAADRANRVQAYDADGNSALIVGVDSGSAAALDLDLRNANSATKGPGQIGAPKFGLNYTAGTLGGWIKDRPTVDIRDNGAAEAGTHTANDAAIQGCVDAMALIGGGDVLVYGAFDFQTITPKSNVRLVGVRGASLMRQVQPSTNIRTGIYKAAGGGSVSNFHVHGISFDGQRIASPANKFNHIISFDMGSGETLDNFSAIDCDMVDAQEDFIRVLITHTNGRAKKIRVNGCSFVTTAAKRAMVGTAYPVAMDAVRLEQTYDYATSGNGYGQVVITDIDITGNYAESIRTLGDCKRGCKNFVIANNRTLNMYDCHHSVDGSFFGTVANNVGRTESSYTGPGTFTNFIEVQGEHVSVLGNTVDGGGKLVSGIMVTDYGRPEEGSSRGHQSVAVKVLGNTVKGNTLNAFRLINGIGCELLDNTAEDCGAHSASVESGTARNDADGVTPLQSIGCRVSGIKSRGAATGVLIAAGAIGVTCGPCPDENGEDFFDIPTTPGPAALIVSAATYGNFRNEAPPANLIANPFFEWSGAGTTNAAYWETSYPALVDASTKPPDVPRAVTLNDSNGASLISARNAVAISLTQGRRLYGRIAAKAGTATQWSVYVQEQDSSGTFIANYFYGTTSPAASWTEYVFRHTAVNANCAQVKVHVSPAAASNNATLTGTTDFAHLRVSRSAIGRS